jgi:hypothetical protein
VGAEAPGADGAPEPAQGGAARAAGPLDGGSGSAAARGERLSPTAALEEARAHPEYIACLDEIALKQFEADAAEVAYTAARALFQAAITAPDEAGQLAA